MKLHLKKELFVNYIRFTAQQMKIPPEFVEKDYWVTYALYTIFNKQIGKIFICKPDRVLIVEMLECASNGYIV